MITSLNSVGMRYIETQQQNLFEARSLQVFIGIEDRACFFSLFKQFVWFLFFSCIHFMYGIIVEKTKLYLYFFIICVISNTISTQHIVYHRYFVFFISESKKKNEKSNKFIRGSVFMFDVITIFNTKIMFFFYVLSLI